MAFQYPTDKPQLTNQLNEHFGNEVELISEDGNAIAFTISKEFVWGATTYVALQAQDNRDEDEVEFLKVVTEGEELELESISDEDEWEAVAEAYDDLLFANDDRP